MNCKINQFTLPNNQTYLNCAYMSPQLKKVEKVGFKALQMKNNPTKIQINDFFKIGKDIRAEFSQLIGNKSYNRIAIIPSVSYGMAIIAKNVALSKGQNIIVAGEQFPSNIYPWQKLVSQKKAKLIMVDSPEAKNRGKSWNEKILDSINKSTRLVSIGNVHWADGTLFNLKKIRKRTKEVGALLVVDGSQSIGALPINVQSLKPDAIICAGYKWLLGPYSIGLGYFGPAFDDGEPIEENWINRLDSENFSGLVNYQATYQPLAFRYNMGEQSQFIQGPMLNESLKTLNKWDPQNIQDYCEKITKKAIEELRQLGCEVENKAYRSNHLFGVRPDNAASMDKISAQLTKDKIYISIRGNSIRISPNVYNTANDLEQLVASLRKVL